MSGVKRPGMIDRFIAKVAPGVALKREKNRMQLEFINSGYSQQGASHIKKSLRSFNDFSSSPDEDITWNRRTLMQRSRSLYMGTPVATGALKTAKTNVVGSGLQLTPTIDADFLKMTEDEADKWESDVAREFALWANNKDCDAARTCNFGKLQQLAFLSMQLSGDVIVLLPVIKFPNRIYDLRVNLVEADRLCNPYDIPELGKFQGGIEVDDYGAPIRYHIAKYYPETQLVQGLNTWTAVEAFGAKTGRRNVLHLFELERPGQRRGVPFLAPVIEALKQLGRYTDAELMAAVVSGCFTVAITTDAPEGQIGEFPDMPLDAPDGLEPIPDDIKLGNGTVVQLAPGEDVKSINPGRPNTAFDPFVTAILRQVGAALEIPMELLVKHFTASYSASRAALLEAWKLFKKQRTALAEDFCQPIYEEWLAEAVAKGRISAPGFFTDEAVKAAYCGAKWNGPSPGQIDPMKEVTAAQKRVENCFSTRAQETIELTGGNFNQNLRQRVKEEKLMRDGKLLPLDALTEVIRDNNNVNEDDANKGGEDNGQANDSKSGE